MTPPPVWRRSWGAIVLSVGAIALLLSLVTGSFSLAGFTVNPLSHHSPAQTFSSQQFQPGPLLSPYVQYQPTQRRLERAAGDRLAQFWPLLELLNGFNQTDWVDFPVTLEFSTCEALGEGMGAINHGQPLGPTYLAAENRIRLCYGLVTLLEDQFDDLAGSLPEQHLAVLDALYLLVARELSHIALSQSPQFQNWPLPGRPPEEPTASPLSSLAPAPASALGRVPTQTLDLFTVLLPQALAQTSQTILLSGSQWLFNQGHPRLSSEQLQRWTGQQLDLDSYGRLVCWSYGLHPQQFPYLAAEVPEALAIAQCPAATQALLAALDKPVP